MKTIGLLGGMSFESTLDYYKEINKIVNKKLGLLHSAKILLYSFDFEEIENLQKKEDWDRLSKALINKAKILEEAGARGLAICTNTMHIVAPQVQNFINIPLINIVDSVGKKIEEKGFKKVALLGTRYTMTKSFYKDKLEYFNIKTLVPNKNQIDIINSIIYKELCVGNILDSSRKEFQRIIDSLKENGAEAVVLGCTEIPLLIKEQDSSLPIFDSTKIHIDSIVDFILD